MDFASIESLTLSSGQQLSKQNKNRVFLSRLAVPKKPIRAKRINDVIVKKIGWIFLFDFEDLVVI